MTVIFRFSLFQYTKLHCTHTNMHAYIHKQSGIIEFNGSFMQRKQLKNLTAGNELYGNVMASK